MTLDLVFETHSLTTDNERGIATGWNGGLLSGRGRALAAELGARRRGNGIELVVASDLPRAVETARIAFGAAGFPLRLDWRLREVDYGALTGSRASMLERVRHVDVPFPDGESFRDVTVRVANVLDELAREYPGRRVLLIGHTATRWALDHLLGAQPLEQLVAAPFDWREGWEYRVRRPRTAAAAA